MVCEAEIQNLALANVIGVAGNPTTTTAIFFSKSIREKILYIIIASDTQLKRSLSYAILDGSNIMIGTTGESLLPYTQ